MTVQIETVNNDRNQSRWNTTKRWLKAIDASMNHDPNEYADTVIRHLLQKIEQLETRVNEIEARKITG